MRKTLLSILLLGILVLAACSAQLPTPTAEPTSEPIAVSVDETPTEEATAALPETVTVGGAAADIANDEGGPVVIVGEANYANNEIQITGQEPVPALIDMSALVQRDYTQFAPTAGQMIGYLTTPLAPAPAAYEIPLAAAPGATPVDVDNDGESDTGVQIFRLLLVSNLNGGSYLEQLDQWTYLNSYRTDEATGEIKSGTFLLYAADDHQGFPTGVGEDGLIFTADDPAVQLPQGYTIARLDEQGAVTFDRSREGRIDVIERAGAAWPDFSQMGILESYHALIDTLAEEYAFTDLRSLDWEAIRATYLPQVEAADAKQDLAAYDAALRTMAQSIRDAHVLTNGPGLKQFEVPIAANLGANVAELSDGRFVVTDIVPGSPLDEAGVVFGSEILSVDGQTVEKRLPTVVYSDSTGTEEGQRLRQVRNLLKFPVGAQVELVYRLPDAQETLTATLKTGVYPLPNPLRFEHGVQMIEYRLLDEVFGYITWPHFEDPIPTVVPYADFLKRLNSGTLTVGLKSPGIILDLRSNGGGWNVQYLTMGSYLFNAEQPAKYRWAEDASFNAETGTWSPAFDPDWLLSAPDPAAYFPGDVVILTDPSCASSCEFFTAFLQSSGRVTVVSQHATNGAGGPIKRAAMPGGFAFQYPWQGVVFAGTDQLVVEAKGIRPDVRVPVTIETELAKSQGEDPVLAAAVEVLQQRAAERLRASINMVPLTDPSNTFTAVVPEGWNPGGGAYVSPTNSEFLTYMVNDPVDPARVLAERGIADPTSALVEERTANGRTWSIYALPTVLQGIPFVRQVALAADDAGTYEIDLLTLPFAVDAAREAVLGPAIAAFMPAPAEVAGGAGEGTFGVAWESVSCDTFDVAPEIAKVADCGYVTVPENRAAGTDTTIRLAVVRVRSSNENPGAPVILGTGGPGGNGLQSASNAAFLQSHVPILADRDWIFFSQRGTQYAQPTLDCPAYNAVLLESAVNGWTDEERRAEGNARMQACLEERTAQGVDLTGYNSNENAADVDAIRQALGYDEIIYYGQSYGTLLGQYLLRNHPEHLAAVMLDGIAPATAEHWSDVTDMPQSFRAVFAACAADEACKAAFPDPEGALIEAMAALDADPAPYTLDLGNGEQVQIEVDDTLAMNALFLNLYVEGGYSQVPWLIDELSKGNYSRLDTTIPLFFANQGTARVMHNAMACSDDPVTSLEQLPLDEMPAVYALLAEDDALTYINNCAILNLPQLPATSDELAESEIPALLLQGGLDPATPVKGGNIVETGLPNSYNVIVPAGSHIQGYSACILEVMAAFMRDPQTAPDTSCIDPSIPFITGPQPVSMSAADGGATITMALPPDFQALATPGQWANSEMTVILGVPGKAKSTDEAFALVAEMLGLTDPEIVDGPMIAGYPSKYLQTETQGHGLDIFAFTDGQTVYQILVDIAKPARIEAIRETILPALLESVTLGEQ